MKRVFAGLAVAVVGLVLSIGLVRAGNKELQIIDASIKGTSVVLKVENTSNALVTGRALGRFNNGVSIQDDVENLVKIEPGVHEVTLDFPEKGSVELQGIQDGPDGFPPGVRPKPGIVLVGTIVDDITPF